MAVKLIISERVKGEGKNPILACNDFVRMGPGRSLPKLLAEYTKPHQDAPPTRSINTLKKWSTDFGWQERATAYDEAIEAEKNVQARLVQQQIAERRKSIMQTDEALDFERVAKLKRLARFLEEQIFYQPQVDEGAAKLLGIEVAIGLAEGTTDKQELSELARMVLARLDPNDPKALYPHVWAHDVRAMAGGKGVDIYRFNAALLAEYRSVLDEIAKETGGRRQRTITENIDYGKLTTEQLQRVAAGEDPIQVILSDYIPGNQG